MHIWRYDLLVLPRELCENAFIKLAFGDLGGAGLSNTFVPVSGVAALHTTAAKKKTAARSRSWHVRWPASSCWYAPARSPR